MLLPMPHNNSYIKPNSANNNRECQIKKFSTVIAEMRRYYSKKNNPRIKEFLRHTTTAIAILSVIAYVTGTIILIYRNWSTGLPFTVITLQQLAVITVYFTISFVVLIGVEWLIDNIGSWNIENKLTHIIMAIIIEVVVICLIIGVISTVLFFFTRNWETALLCSTIIFLIIPYFFYTFRLGTGIKVIAFSIASLIIISIIPQNLGGLRSQEALFCAYDTKECHKVEYYGTADGLHQLVYEGKVLLIPIDKGYLSYPKENT